MPIPYIQIHSLEEFDVSFIVDELLKESIEKLLLNIIAYQQGLDDINSGINIWEYIYLFSVVEGELLVKIRNHLDNLANVSEIRVQRDGREIVIDVFGIAFQAVQDIIVYGNDFRTMYNLITIKNNCIFKRIEGDTSKETLDRLIDATSKIRQMYQKSSTEIMNHWFSKNFL